MSNIKLPIVNFVCDTTNTRDRAMTFKFLNFYVLKPGKKYPKNEFTSPHLIKNMKRKRIDVHYVMSLCCLHCNELMPGERFKTQKFTPPNSTFEYRRPARKQVSFCGVA